ncbi:MAG: hypothetical protein WDO19_11220 [Bacteroidota bacterium]
MNRAHSAEQAVKSLELSVQYFDNITIDLIYGTPQLTNERWKQNVQKIVSYNIPHISCYALTVEPKTPLQKMILQGKSENINPDKQSEQFLLLMQWLGEAGYEHYEISNFAKHGFRSGIIHLTGREKSTLVSALRRIHSMGIAVNGMSRIIIYISLLSVKTFFHLKKKY